MPNWACGDVIVTGTKQGVLDFTGRFIYDIDKGVCMYTVGGFFAKSFVHRYRQSVLDEINDIFQEPDTISSFTLPIDFAWSAHSCLIDGDPQENAECVTLAEACLIDKVAVEILTEEPGMSFEEQITCDEYGECDSQHRELDVYKCPSCGSTYGIASFKDPDDYYCYECDEVGLEPVVEVECND